MWFVWLAVRIFATTFSIVWDLRVDWGFTMYWKLDAWGLRPPAKLRFTKTFYYWAIVSNICLRFFWVIFIVVPFEIYDVSGKVNVYKTFSMSLAF